MGFFSKTKFKLKEKNNKNLYFICLFFVVLKILLIFYRYYLFIYSYYYCYYSAAVLFWSFPTRKHTEKKYLKFLKFLCCNASKSTNGWAGAGRLVDDGRTSQLNKSQQNPPQICPHPERVILEFYLLLARPQKFVRSGILYEALHRNMSC